MSREEFVVKEKKKLQEDRAQIAEELENLRELMQAEVDVEPDEGDAEIFEREKNAALIAVGNLAHEEIERLASRHLQEWKRSQPAPAEFDVASSVERTQVFLVDREGSVQSEIRVGHG